MKIVPAILADNFELALSRWRQVEKYADYLHIDMMDGEFVPARSFPAEAIKTLQGKIPFEVHLMVANPWDYLDRMDNLNLRQVFFHFEAKTTNPLNLIAALKQKSIKAGLAIKPGTDLDEFRELTQVADALLFLTVDPGNYGSPFKPEVLNKIARTRHLFPDKTIAVDGGVSLDNLREFLELGIDYACIGSRIFLKGNPEENYKQFIRKLNELDTRPSSPG